jgi:hypothetical protein
VNEIQAQAIGSNNDGEVFQEQIPKPNNELELAREVQLTLTAGLFAIQDPDTQSRRRSQLKFLKVLVESLLEEIEAALWDTA